MLTNVFTRARLARAGAALIVGGVLIAIACEAPAPTAPIAPRTVATTADSPPLQVSSPTIVYPPLLREAGIQGAATIQAIVKDDGRVDSASAHIVEGTNMILARAALEAMRQSVFKPAVINGKPTPMQVRQDFRFLIARPDGTHDAVSDSTGQAVVVVAEPNRRPATQHADTSLVFVRPVGAAGEGTPGGFNVTTSEAAGFPATHTLAYNQVLDYPPLLFEAGIVGTVAVDFVVQSSGQVEPGSIKFAPGANPQLEVSVRRSLAGANFAQAFVGTDATTRRAHQTVQFAREGHGAAAKPFVKATTMWDRP